MVCVRKSVCVCVELGRGKKEGLAAQKREQAKRANDAIFDFSLLRLKRIGVGKY